MALIKCRECGREISDKADSCPNCGNPVSNPRRYQQFYKPPELHNPEENYQQNRHNYQASYYQEPQRRNSSKISVLGVISILLSMISYTFSVMAIISAGNMTNNVKSQLANMIIPYNTAKETGKTAETYEEPEKIEKEPMTIEEVPIIEKEETSVDLSSQMEVTEYSMENAIGATYYIMIVKNNSSETVEIASNAIAKDSNGKTIGAASSEEPVVESGQEICLFHYFDNITDVSKFEYTLSVKKRNLLQACFFRLICR